MEYTFDVKSVIERIKRIDDYKYSIHFRIPTGLREDYDLLIEQDIGTDDTAILDDCTEEETSDGFIVGDVTLSFDESTEYPKRYDIVFNRASQLDMLSNGVSLIEESEV